MLYHEPQKEESMEAKSAVVMFEYLSNHHLLECSVLLLATWKTARFFTTVQQRLLTAEKNLNDLVMQTRSKRGK